MRKESELYQPSLIGACLSVFRMLPARDTSSRRVIRDLYPLHLCIYANECYSLHPAEFRAWRNKLRQRDEMSQGPVTV